MVEMLPALQVKGKENYEILRKMRDALELSALVPSQTVEAYKLQQIETHKQ